MYRRIASDLPQDYSVQTRIAVAEPVTSGRQTQLSTEPAGRFRPQRYRPLSCWTYSPGRQTASPGLLRPNTPQLIVRAVAKALTDEP